MINISLSRDRILKYGLKSCKFLLTFNTKLLFQDKKHTEIYTHLQSCFNKELSSDIFEP